MQTGTAIASTGFTLLLRELPIYQVARKSRVYLMVTKRGKAEERKDITPNPETGRQKKKTEAAFTIFTSNKTLQRTILIAQVKAMDGRGIPQGRWARRIGTRRGASASEGKLGTPLGPRHGSQGATNLIPFFLTLLETLVSIGAVASE